MLLIYFVCCVVMFFVLSFAFFRIETCHGSSRNTLALDEILDITLHAFLCALVWPIVIMMLIGSVFMVLLNYDLKKKMSKREKTEQPQARRSAP